MNPFKSVVLVSCGLAVLSVVGCCPDTDLLTESPFYEAASFEVEGDMARMYGVIDGTTPGVVQELVTNHPEVRTIVMMDVPGSADDPSNFKAARLIRDHGLNTLVPSNAVIASGGVDFFLAGVERTVLGCGKLGVHDWENEDEDGTTVRGAEVPPDDQMHTEYLEYYRAIGAPEEFYWFTLEIAPPGRMHWMSNDELQGFGLTTGEGS